MSNVKFQWSKSINKQDYKGEEKTFICTKYIVNNTHIVSIHANVYPDYTFHSFDVRRINPEKYDEKIYIYEKDDGSDVESVEIQTTAHGSISPYDMLLKTKLMIDCVEACRTICDELLPRIYGGEK